MSVSHGKFRNRAQMTDYRDQGQLFWAVPLLIEIKLQFMIGMTCQNIPMKTKSSWMWIGPLSTTLTVRMLCDVVIVDARILLIILLDQSSEELDNRKEELLDLITEVLRRQPHLRYFQG